ncbi:globin [Vibrio cholerae]|jgi:hemoglobin|nr:globin [Vibrio cholerae]
MSGQERTGAGQDAGDRTPPTAPSSGAQLPLRAAGASVPLPADRLVATGQQFTQPQYTENFYETVGGHATFVRLVDVFYAGVAGDDVLRPMYPEEDLGPAKERLLLFLEQYWGGPKTYGEQRGHPRLRMRHVPFRVGPEARDRWLLHMRAAVDALGLAPLHEATLWDYLDRAAHSMVNAAD